MLDPPLVVEAVPCVLPAGPDDAPAEVIDMETVIKPVVADVVGEISLANAAVSVVARHASVVDPARLTFALPGGQTLAGTLQKGEPGMVTLSHTKPALLEQQLAPQRLGNGSYVSFGEYQ